MRTPRTLTPDDLERYAIWEEIGTEGVGLDDMRLRPRPDLTVAADDESETDLYFVATSFTLADGDVLTGYCSPTPRRVLNRRFRRFWLRGIGLLRPTIVLQRGQVPFWFDEEPDRQQLLALYDILGRSPQQVFPIDFEARVAVRPDHFASGRLDGFHFLRRPPFVSPFPALNRTLLADRLGDVR